MPYDPRARGKRNPRSVVPPARVRRLGIPPSLVVPGGSVPDEGDTGNGTFDSPWHIDVTVDGTDDRTLLGHGDILYPTADPQFGYSTDIGCEPFLGLFAFTGPDAAPLTDNYKLNFFGIPGYHLVWYIPDGPLVEDLGGEWWNQNNPGDGITVDARYAPNSGYLVVAPAIGEVADDFTLQWFSSHIDNDNLGNVGDFGEIDISVPGDVDGTLAGATWESGEAQYGEVGSVWYYFMPTELGTIDFTVTGVAVPLTFTIEVYSQPDDIPSFDEMTDITQEDGEFTFEVTALEPHYIQVNAAAFEEGGSFNLAWGEFTPTP